MSTRKSNQNVIAALLVAILALAGINIYQYINRNALVETNKQQETELVSMEKAKTELDKEFYEALSELEEMKSDNEELNEMIDAQKEDLTKQKRRISSLLTDSKNLEEARSEIVKMKESAEQYLAEITVLREENQVLNDSNVVLSQVRKELTSVVQTQKETNESLVEEREGLLQTQKELSEEKDELTVKVKQASTIAIANLQGTGFALKDSGKESRKRKAQNVDFVRVCFDLTVNDVADNGQEEFFVRMISPVGETLAMENMGSGVLVSNDTGNKLRYTKSISYDYQGQEENVCLDWQPGSEFSSGVYKVEVYNKGFLAGEGSFKLR